MTRTLALAAAAIALIAGGAHAQTRPKPDDPTVPVAPVTYASPFDGYRTHADEPIASWGEVNDEVGRVGGHVGVLRAEERDAAQPAAATAPSTPSAHTMPPGMHSGGHAK
ncbi:MAG: hypothetical protein KJ025_04805 [Burkholderiales bacterium]|nr:hypothetical protein [Burkholderiales bacterium]